MTEQQYEPQRLLNGTDPAEAELREALRVASQDAPNALQLEQITEGVLGTLATGAGVGAGVSGSALKWVALKSGWTKLAVVAFTVGGAAWVTTRGLPDGGSSGQAARPTQQAASAPLLEQTEQKLPAAPTTTPGVRAEQAAAASPSAAQDARDDGLLGPEHDLRPDEVAAAQDDGAPSVRAATRARRSRRAIRRRPRRGTRAATLRAGHGTTAAASASKTLGSAPAATPTREAQPTAEEDRTRQETVEEKAPQYDPAELELVGQAQRALAQNPASALALLEQHRRTQPDSAYAQERDALILDALLRLDRIDALRSQASAFLARYPRSPHRQRVRELLRQAAASAP